MWVVSWIDLKSTPLFQTMVIFSECPENFVSCRTLPEILLLEKSYLGFDFQKTIQSSDSSFSFLPNTLLLFKIGCHSIGRVLLVGASVLNDWQRKKHTWSCEETWGVLSTVKIWNSSKLCLLRNFVLISSEFRCSDWYHCHVCPVNMKPRAAS